MPSDNTLGSIQLDKVDTFSEADATLLPTPATASKSRHSEPSNQEKSLSETSAIYQDRVVGVSNTEGRYGRVAELGRGGWGVVERVVDRQLEREVAVKRLGKSREVSHDARQRFLHEAKITSQLQHPGVVPVHELGIESSGEAYYVMKLLEGETLGDNIRARHAPSRQPGHRWTSVTLKTAITPLLHRFIDVCNAMAYAHQQGVIHRDLKPVNVMDCAFGETIVVDWGLAKKVNANRLAPDDQQTRCTGDFLHESEESLRHLASYDSPGTSDPDSHQPTSQGTIVGTPAYMSPEQARGEVDFLGPRSDIFSLGAILYEIIVGRNPHPGLDVISIISRIRSGSWDSPRAKQPCTPKALVAICEKAMSFDPMARYACAQLLAEDVSRFIAGETISAYNEPLLDRVLRWFRRHRTIATITATSAFALLMTSVVVCFVIHDAHQKEQAAHLETQVANHATLESLIEARDATDSWLVELSVALEYYPGLKATRFELIEVAIKQYERVISEAQAMTINDDIETGATPIITSSQAMVLEHAKCLVRIGDLYRITGRYDDAWQSFERATELARSLEQANPQRWDSAVSKIALSMDLVDDYNNFVKLQIINSAIGRCLITNRKLKTTLDIDDRQALPQEEELTEYSRWLQQYLKPFEPLSDSTAVKQSSPSDFPFRAASALTRLELARYYARKVETPDEEPAIGIELAAKWSTWLATKRGRSSDCMQAENALRELAVFHESNADHGNAARAWQAMVNQLSRGINAEDPRPDRLSSLAQARMNLARAINHDSQSDQQKKAVSELRIAMVDLQKSWRMLDVDRFLQNAVANIINKLDNAATSETLIRHELEINPKLLLQAGAADFLRQLAGAQSVLATILTHSNPTSANECFNDANLVYESLNEYSLVTNDDRIDWINNLIDQARHQHRVTSIESAQRNLVAAAEQLALIDDRSLDLVSKRRRNRMERELNDLRLTFTAL